MTPERSLHGWEQILCAMHREMLPDLSWDAACAAMADELSFLLENGRPEVADLTGGFETRYFLLGETGELGVRHMFRGWFRVGRLVGGEIHDPGYFSLGEPELN